NYYAPIDYYNLSKKFGKKELDSTISKLSTYNLIIIGINKMTSKAGSNFGVSDETNDLIDSLLIRNNIILTVFGIPYILSDIRNINKATGIIISYQDNKYTQSLSAQLIFGGIKSKGKLPVSINQFYKINDGLSSSEPSRLKYYIPEGLNISSETLSAIDTIALKGIAKKAFPGCQILVVYKGSVIYYKSFGNHTYDKKHPVLNDDIYDLASVTKTAATTLAVMKLYDDGLINLDRPLSDYLPILKNSNKENLIIRDIMTHQARLMPWIPFYKKTILKNKYIDGIYSKIQSDSFPFKVADSLFIRKDYRDTIINEIIKSPLNKKAHYLYSDLGFYLLREAIEKITGMKFEEYLNKTFYKPLGLSTMCFQPYKYYAKDRIPPTENDKEFRNQLIHSTVHDQGAAMLGGISGHAGLFSDANDLAILMEMLLKKGTYGGIKYIKEETVNEFTKYQFPNKNNRRALGFDKPILKNVKGGPACKNASQLSFGHTGFTGTMFWVDPRYELVYVFLSNRVYPDANNTKLADMNIRTDIQQIIYNAILPTNMNNK
ncbi:MAG: serine hydrolase, partial [Bacteroidota bacterium]|nr:serine hydrolase [Bacteroidota bacterium]